MFGRSRVDWGDGSSETPVLAPPDRLLMSQRVAGILLHPTSLPGRFGIGELGPEAVRFLDWMAGAGQSIWQVLPLGPTGFANSPYATLSAFAGNSLLVSPERLVEAGLLGADALERAPAFPEGRVDYDAVGKWKDALLRESWGLVNGDGVGGATTRREVRAAVRAWADAPEQADWLPAWALFAALKRRSGGAGWRSWDSGVRRRDPAALAHAAAEARDEIEFQEYIQFVFFQQWEAVRRAAHDRGIEVFGDAPIYVPFDSADVWERPDCFQLNGDLEPEAVSGVPPDYFSETGQLWGTPLYRWDRLEADGFAWWIQRVRAELRRFDLLRLDHFRAFQAYWSIPARAKSAAEGRWLPGPGIRVFRALEAALGNLPLVAEDLGDIDEDVRGLVRDTGFPGMRVLQFGFGDPKSIHRPDRYPANCVAYTGTHDNDTLRGWLEGMGDDERLRVERWLRERSGEGHAGAAGRANAVDGLARGLTHALYASAADRVIAPMQDFLGLGTEARMNVPAVERGNWEWRLLSNWMEPPPTDDLRSTTASTGRSLST